MRLLKTVLDEIHDQKVPTGCCPACGRYRGISWVSNYTQSHPHWTRTADCQHCGRTTCVRLFAPETGCSHARDVVESVEVS